MASADDLIEEALRGQRPEFAAEVRRAYRRAGPVERADLLAFFSSDVPRRLGECMKKSADGTPTAADLEGWVGE